MAACKRLPMSLVVPVMASALAQNLRTSGPHVGALIVGLLVAAAGAGTMADDWPQFRGPNASGVSTARAPLPARFSLEEKVRWSHTLGDGVSSPIVVGDRVYATAMTGAQTFGVFCFAARDGSLLWKQELATGKLPVIMEPNSHAASTPTADRQRVVVYFSTLGLIAFGAADGRPLWRHELPVPAYLMDWGAAASPILYEDLVIFNQDDDLHPYCIALDAQSGETRWKADRPDMLAGYAVPVLCRAAGRTDLVIAGTGKLQGYDPATGAERWTCNSLLRTIMTSPVVQDDCIYVAVQSYGDTERTVKYALLEWKDTNQDHKLAKTELSPDFAERFDRADRDHDGFLDESELDTAFQSADNLVGGGSIIQSIRGGGQGDVTKTHMVWQLNSRAPSNLASPLVVGGLLYTIKRGGLASCFDAATGAPRYETKRIQNLGEYYASPVAGDGKIYLAGENGFVVVLEQGPQLKVLAKNDLGESCFATPAIADGALYFRTRQKLFCIADDSR